MIKYLLAHDASMQLVGVLTNGSNKIKVAKRYRAIRKPNTSLPGDMANFFMGWSHLRVSNQYLSYFERR